MGKKERIYQSNINQNTSFCLGRQLREGMFSWGLKVITVVVVNTDYTAVMTVTLNMWEEERSDPTNCKQSTTQITWWHSKLQGGRFYWEPGPPKTKHNKNKY